MDMKFQSEPMSFGRDTEIARNTHQWMRLWVQGQERKSDGGRESRAEGNGDGWEERKTSADEVAGARSGGRELVLGSRLFHDPLRHR